MPTLLLRLAAPIQSWGGEAKFDLRGTKHEPTKSGVIGLLAAACGVRRDDTASLAQLNTLRLGVRVDREGRYMRDYHTIKCVKKNSCGKRTFYQIHDMWLNLQDPYMDAYVTQRYYLCDAVFLCGLESDDAELLKKCTYQLLHPAYPLYLGRRACPPTLPLVLGIRDCGLEKALTDEPRLTADTDDMRLVLEADTHDTNAAMRKDVATAFGPYRHDFGYRRCVEKLLIADNKAAEGTEENVCT